MACCFKKLFGEKQSWTPPVFEGAHGTFITRTPPPIPPSPVVLPQVPTKTENGTRHGSGDSGIDPDRTSNVHRTELSPSPIPISKPPAPIQTPIAIPVNVTPTKPQTPPIFTKVPPPKQLIPEEVHIEKIRPVVPPSPVITKVTAPKPPTPTMQLAEETYVDKVIAAPPSPVPVPVITKVTAPKPPTPTMQKAEEIYVEKVITTPPSPVPVPVITKVTAPKPTAMEIPEEIYVEKVIAAPQSPVPVITKVVAPKPPAPVPTPTPMQDEPTARIVLDEPAPQEARREGYSDKIKEKPGKDIKIPVIDKDEISKELIKTAIYNNDFINNMMDTERLEAVVNAMSSKILEPGNYIITEGDTGSSFYVSANGEFEVIKDNKVLKTFGSGVVFGELAILYKAKRFASIRVKTPSKIWMLERKTFQKIMMTTGRKERNENIKFLDSVSILSGLNPSILSNIADLLKREFYATGTTIIQQGDPGDKFYIIRGGNVTVVKRDNTGKERVVGNLKRTDYFGEQALIHQDKRLASIIANEPGVECLTLDRISFEQYLGKIEDLRKRPVDPPIKEVSEPSATVNPRFRDHQHIKFDDLEIIGTLGVGGFGRVELVQYKDKDTFALKYLKKIEMVQQQQQEHAYSEKDIMATCDSPFIVKLFNTYRDKKYLYFLMEPCLGGDVWTVLQKTKFFDEKTARFMTACVIESFEYLHTRNMIYRDLKPENLMLDNRGYVKLVDFGFAKRINPSHKTWTFAGTPEYVAPEIILNKGHDRAVDYWALGVFIHELLVGKPPFRGSDHMKTYTLILRGIDAIQFPQRIPKKAQALIKKLCRQSPIERLGYQKDGIEDIKKHAWFVGFDWEKLQSQTMPAPLIRPVKSNKDLSNFDEYPKDRDDPPDEVSGWDIYF